MSLELRLWNICGNCTKAWSSLLEMDAHGLQGGAPAVAAHVAVQHQHVRRVAHQARHPEQSVERAGLEVVRSRSPSASRGTRTPATDVAPRAAPLEAPLR
uniref:Uncharacterized protein n=1 Tax=Arundo donax TaxID=35708 RepID=A0A0A9G286_ARUDO